MTETYSLNIDGFPAEQANTLAKPNYTLPDSGARPGSQLLAMQQGKQLLVQNPDGSQSWYTLDAERSTAANPVLRRV